MKETTTEQPAAASSPAPSQVTGTSDTGASPVETVLTALGACSAMDVVSILAKKRQDVTAYRIDVRGLQRDEYPQVYLEITLRHEVDGREVLVDRAARRYDPEWVGMRGPAVSVSRLRKGILMRVLAIAVCWMAVGCATVRMGRKIDPEVVKGFPAIMPPSNMSDADVAAVTAYIRSLGGPTR